MSDNSKIEWTDATWNPIRARNKKTGKVGHYCQLISPGCAHCYASKFQSRFGLPAYSGKGKTEASSQANAGAAGAISVSDDIEVFLDDRVMRQPLTWKKGRRIFVCSMTDLFGEWVPDGWIDKCFAVMAAAGRHTHQVLTKRPDRMLSYMESRSKSSKYWEEAIRAFGYTLRWENDGQSFGLCQFPLPNVWLGVSVENQQYADERIPPLLQTPAAVRFLSVEPMLGAVDLAAWLPHAAVYIPAEPSPSGKSRVRCLRCGRLTAGMEKECRSFGTANTGVDWVIGGGESGPNARPMNPQWVRALRDQCQAADAPFFFKQWGEYQEVHCVGDAAGCFLGDRWQTEIPNNPGGHPYYSGHFPEKYPELTPIQLMTRVGKKAAGNLLDGRTWQEFPKGATP